MIKSLWRIFPPKLIEKRRPLGAGEKDNKEE